MERETSVRQREAEQSDLFRRPPALVRWTDLPDQVREVAVELIAQLLLEASLQEGTRND